MKLSELKHNHSLTDLLKILLFAILMLAPIFSVAVRCAYVVCNKNAYQSYYGETINEKEYVDIETYEENQTYHFVSTQNTLTSTFNNNYFTCTRIENIVSTPTISQNIKSTNNGFLYFNSGTNAPTLALFNNDTNIMYLNLNTFIVEFDIVNLATQQNQNTQLISYLKNIEYNNYSYLDNVFEYSVSQLEESNLFNWTENTAIFSGIQTMTTQLGITNQTIPILLVYWFLLTVIYVIIDIILKLFTYMTHAIGSRKT